MIAVSDTGTGIPQDHIDRVFEAFFNTQARGKGTGLGLKHGLWLRQADETAIFGFYSEEKRRHDREALFSKGERTCRGYGAWTGRRAADGGTGNHSGGGGYKMIFAAADSAAADSLAIPSARPVSEGASALAILKEAGDIDLLFTDVVLPGRHERAGRSPTRRRRCARPEVSCSPRAIPRMRSCITGVSTAEVEMLSKPSRRTALAAKVRKVLRCVEHRAGAGGRAGPRGGAGLKLSSTSLIFVGRSARQVGLAQKVHAGSSRP